MQLSDKLKEYLVNSLMRDKENLEREILTKEDIIAKLGIENGKEKTIADDWKLKYFKLEEENCELKKENVRLKEKEVKVIPLLEAESKREEYIKELENKIKLFEEDNNILNDKIKDLEQELLKKAIIECEPKEKGKPGRKPGIKK